MLPTGLQMKFLDVLEASVTLVHALPVRRTEALVRVACTVAGFASYARDWELGMNCGVGCSLVGSHSIAAH